MGFFDDINKIVSDLGEKTLQKTKEISDVARFNTFVADEERKLNSAYCQIGKMYIAKYGNNCDEEFAALISTVAECTEKIKEYKSQICEIKGVQPCPNCGAEISRGFTFCSACGSQLGSVSTEGTATDIVEGTGEFKAAEAVVETAEFKAAENVEVQTAEAVETATEFKAEEAVETTAEENNAGNVEEDMKCTCCGQSVKEGTSFCMFCGTAVSKSPKSDMPKSTITLQKQD